MSHYRFVAIEGTGKGKTAVRKQLFQAFRSLGDEALTINQMGWLLPQPARVITEAYYRGVPHPPDRIVEAYVADKVACTQRLIRPHLPLRHVIADRYTASDATLFATLWGFETDEVLARYRAAGVHRPDLTIVLDLPLSEAMHRLQVKPAEQRLWWETPETVECHHVTLTRLLEGDHHPDFGHIAHVHAVGGREPLIALLEERIRPPVANA